MDNLEAVFTEIENRQAEITKLQAEMQKKVEEYKNYTRETIGLADGDKTDVVGMARAVYKIMGFLKK